MLLFEPVPKETGLICVQFYRIKIKGEGHMAMNIVAAICAVIAIGAGIWGFWFEYTQNHRDNSDTDETGHEQTQK